MSGASGCIATTEPQANEFDTTTINPPADAGGFFVRLAGAPIRPDHSPPLRSQ